MPHLQQEEKAAAPAAAVTLVTESLEKPSLDDRSYRVIRLENELEALLVHDPETDKASAALDCNVGNFSDEADIPGMAHAVEHVSPAIVAQLTFRIFTDPSLFSCFSWVPRSSR